MSSGLLQLQGITVLVFQLAVLMFAVCLGVQTAVELVDSQRHPEAHSPVHSHPLGHNPLCHLLHYLLQAVFEAPALHEQSCICHQIGSARPSICSENKDFSMSKR